jgi:glycosyltransferase involved in cell wall biosynthesis
MSEWHPYISRVGHYLREAVVHVDRLFQRRDLPRIVFSVGNANMGGSSGLRAYAISKELRKLGWRTSVMPKQLELWQRQRLVHLERPDIIVFQNARHPLNRPKYYPNTTCVFDIDDADFLYPPLREGVVECMVNSSGVIAGSRFVADFARKYNPQVEVIWTGSTPSARRPTPKLHPPIVAFAPSDAKVYPEECELVVSALNRIKNNDWQFWLFGVNDFDFGRRTTKVLEDRHIVCRTFPFMNYQKFLRAIENVSIGLAPIIPSDAGHVAGKSFGKILFYLNGRAVTVASDYADHSLFIQNGVNGYLASSAEEFSACIELLLSDTELRERISERAYRDYVDKLSTRTAAYKTDSFIRGLMRGVRDGNSGAGFR